jgi:hypothetical protein
MQGEAGTQRRRIRSSDRRALRVAIAQVAFWSLLAGPGIGAAHGAVNAQARLGATRSMVASASLAAAAAPVEVATLIQTIQTSQFSPGSPDPAGITYIPGATPAQDRLMIADSEVDEVTGAGWHGVNLWEITTTGIVTGTGTTWTGSSSTPPNYSREPTGLGFDPATRTLFVSSDAGNKVYIVRSGPDGDFGTADDVVSWIDALAYGSTDTEDPEFDPITGHLFFLDGMATELYEIDPGSGGAFGDGNDVMTHFDVGQFASDIEGLASDPARNTLLLGGRTTKKIYEITKSGALVRTIDASGVPGLRFISGLKMAPASDNSGRMNYWIVDRQIDNGPDPAENDGKAFELSVPGLDVSPTVTITGPAEGSTVSGTVTARADAFDDDSVVSVQFSVDGSPLGSPDIDGTDGWSALWDTAASGDGPHTVTASANDTTGHTGSDANAVTVDNTSPTADITSPLPGATVTGTVTVQAAADDTSGVASVTFRVDGVSIGTDTNGVDGWSVPWNTVASGNGPHQLIGVAMDLAGNQTTSVSVTVTVDNPTFVDVAIASGFDDVEERANGVMNNTSTDLDLIIDGTSVQRAVGLRFVTVGVPQGATIVSAYVQFQANEVTSEPTTLTVQGQASDDAPAFSGRKFNVTNRARTTASVLWTPNSWTQKGARGVGQRVDVAPVIQEIVDRGGWGPSNALVLIVTGSGRRVAESFEGLAPPVLHIDYVQ